MNTIYRFLLCTLFCLFSMQTLKADELTTEYRYIYNNGVVHKSEIAAQEDMYNDNLIGADILIHGWSRYILRRQYYYIPSTSNVNESSGIRYNSGGFFYSNCNDKPINNQFGQDVSFNSSTYCESYSNWETAFQTVAGGACNEYEILNEGPWYHIGYSNFPYITNDEIQPVLTLYEKKIDFRQKTGFPACTSWTNRTQYVTEARDGHCPKGYAGFQTSNGPECYNTLKPYIIESGAKNAVAGKQCGNGNPCHPTNGNKTASENDYTSPTLEFTRYYNSIMSYKERARMGRGWSHTYDRFFQEIPDKSPKTYRYQNEEGHEEHFVCTNAPTCTSYRSTNQSGVLLEHVGSEYEIQYPNGDKLTFNPSKRLKRIEKRSGRYIDIEVTYNTNGHVNATTDQFGRSIQFTYNSDNLIGSITLPSGEQIQYQYQRPSTVATHVDWRQNLTKVIREDLSERIYHYEDEDGSGNIRFAHLLTGITDEKNNRYAIYAYDDKTRVTSSEHAGGTQKYTLEYTKRPGESYTWSITKVTTPLGEVKTYDMESGHFRKPTEIEDSRGSILNTYDATTNWRTSNTDREGNVTNYVYADGLHQTKRTEAVGTLQERIIETDWDNTVNQPDEIREPGKRTEFTYNSRGQVLTHTEVDTTTNDTRTWTYTYYESPSATELIGQLKQVNGPRTDVTDTTDYDYYTSTTTDYKKGDLWKITNALSHATEYLKYDADGRPLQIKDANGVITTMVYNDRGWITSTTIDSQTTTIAYEATGNISKVTQPDNSYIEYEYDNAQRLTAMEDILGNRIEYTLDNAGNRTAEKTYDTQSNLRRQLSRTYTQLNQLNKLIDGNLDETVFAYDDNNNRTSSTDANNKLTQFEYDPLDRLIKTIDALSGDTLMAYDARDNLISVTDPLGNVTDYTYDGLNNQIELDSPDTGVTTYVYDDAGNRTSMTDARNITTNYSYDALNRLTQITYSDTNLNVTFTYDSGTNGKGRLTGMSDEVGTASYTYDARGNLLTESRGIDTVTYTTTYTYNGADRLTSITYPSGMKLSYTLDTAGRVTTIRRTDGGNNITILSSIAYEPFGPVKSWTFGNNEVRTLTYDQDYELDAIDSGQGLDWSIGYDDVGNILTITDNNNSSYNQTFTYDNLYRLDTASGTYGSEDYNHDANGNRTAFINNTVNDSYTYQAQSNKLSTQNGWDFDRDTNGNRTRKYDNSGAGYLYNFGDHNRLDEVTERTIVMQNGVPTIVDTVVGEYEFNGSGQRAKKTASSVTTHYIFGPGGELLGDYQSNGTAINEYIYFNGQPVALTGNAALSTTFHYIHTDQLGTPRAITDASQTVVWKWDSNPFGNTAPDEDPDGNQVDFTFNQRFPGQYYDDESELHYNYFRDYDPSIGRYIESDPAGMVGGINTYWYVMNQPTKLTDPLGLFPFDDEFGTGQPRPRFPNQEPIIVWLCNQFGICAEEIPENTTPVSCQVQCDRFRVACLFGAVVGGATSGLVSGAVCTYATAGTLVYGCAAVSRGIIGAAVTSEITSRCLTIEAACRQRCSTTCSGS